MYCSLVGQLSRRSQTRGITEWKAAKDAVGNNSHCNTAVTTALLLCHPVEVLLSYSSYIGYPSP